LPIGPVPFPPPEPEPPVPVPPPEPVPPPLEVVVPPVPVEVVVLVVVEPVPPPFEPPPPGFECWPLGPLTPVAPLIPDGEGLGSLEPHPATVSATATAVAARIKTLTDSPVESRLAQPAVRAVADVEADQLVAATAGAQVLG
jgi:hypothetical protein